jgi:hypothetical protein
MSNLSSDIDDRLRKLEECLRNHPDPDVNIWMDEIRELRFLLKKEHEDGQSNNKEIRNTEITNSLTRGLALAKLLWDLIDVINKRPKD